MFTVHSTQVDSRLLKSNSQRLNDKISCILSAILTNEDCILLHCINNIKSKNDDHLPSANTSLGGA